MDIISSEIIKKLQKNRGGDQIQSRRGEKLLKSGKNVQHYHQPECGHVAHFAACKAARRNHDLGDGAEFVDKRDNVRFAVARQTVRHRPHMIYDHIPLKLGYREHLGGVAERSYRVLLGVGAHKLLVILAVVEEEIVKQPRSGGRTRVQVQQLAQLVVVIRYVERVLKARRAYMMAEAAQAEHRAVSEQIPHIAEIFVLK